MAHSEIRKVVTDTRLKTLKLADSSKWKILNKNLILKKTNEARKLLVELKEENLKITRKLDYLDAILYRLYYQNTNQFNEQK